MDIINEYAPLTLDNGEHFQIIPNLMFWPKKNNNQNNTNDRVRALYNSISIQIEKKKFIPW